MTHRRTNIYLPNEQLEKLGEISEQENLPVAELVRRAIDAYLVWRDPGYSPVFVRSKKQRKEET